jgi:hypothetical protein
MQPTIAAILLQCKVEYYGTIILWQPVIIAWSFWRAGKHILWLTPKDEFVKPNIPAVILICQEKPAKLFKVTESIMT